MPDSVNSSGEHSPTSNLLVAGKPAPLEELKEVFGDLSPHELLHCLRLDQDNRWHMGTPVCVENYFKAFPVLNQDQDHMIVLIFGEVMVRLQLGEEPRLADYQQLFPQLADRLGLLFDLQQAPDEEIDHTNLVPIGKGINVHKDADKRLQPTVPGYEIMEPLGHGGMGVVYKARQLSLNRVVALKMILAGGYARPKQLTNFRKEAELAARLQHPNIVQVFEVGVHAGHAFLSMEYIEGGSLAQKIGGQPQDPRWAGQIVETLALAIYEAHRKEIIHRDLKPANVLLQPTTLGPQDHPASIKNLVPKIADFGLAHVVDGDSQISTTNAYLGTPCYMAPEQAEGRARDIGPRTDIYSLGAIFYELLTGQPPFRGNSPWETLSQIKTMDPVPPSRSQPNIPRDLETICLKCLEKAPERRYATASHLADDLRRFRQGEVISARPIGLLEKTSRWTRRNPGWAAMFASSAVLLLVIAIAEVFSNWRLEKQLNQTQNEKVRAEKAENELKLENMEVKKAQQLAEEKEWEALVAQAAGLRTSQRSGQRFKTLRVLEEALKLGRSLNLPKEKIDQMRDLWVTTSAVPDLFPDLSWSGYPSGSVGVDFDENLQIYARMDRHGQCTVRQVADDRELFHLDSPTELEPNDIDNYPILSRDGRYLALRFGNGLVHLYKLEHQKPVLVLKEKEVYRLEFDARGDSLVLGHRDGVLSWYDTASGKVKIELPVKGFADLNIALHPSEPLVAVWPAKKPDAEVYDLRYGRSVAFIPSGAFPFADLAWQPDGNTLAASIPSGIIFFDRTNMYKPAGDFRTSSGPAVIAYNNTGTLLAAMSWNHEVLLLQADTGQTLFNLPPTTTPLTRLRFNKSGNRLAAFAKNGQLGIWKVAEAREQRVLSNGKCPGPSKYLSCAISPKYPSLLAVGMEEGLGFWDLASGQEMAFERIQGILRVLFEPNGDLLTCGSAGTFRWPLRMVASRLHCGSPDSIGTPANDLALNREGTLLATGAWNVKPFADYSGIRVLPLEKEKIAKVLAKGRNVKHVALSPDGQWLAAGFESQTNLEVWDWRQEALVKEFSGLGNLPRFSSDGKWLAISGESGGLFQTGSWQAGIEVPGLIAFSHDGKILAVETGEGVIRLLNLTTGNEFGRLEDPNLAVAEKLQFSLDDRKILTINNGPQPGIRVWDLPLVRQDLAEVGLDWDAPPFPNMNKASKGPLPTIEIEMNR